MVKKTVLVISLFVLFLNSQSQVVGYSTTDIGGELQWYPAGLIAGLHIAYNAPLHHSVQFRAGYNKANRKDWGKHDHEEGGGPGIGIGYRYYFSYKPHGLFIGAHTDIWHLKIDWRNGLVTGTSKTWTLQPVAAIGYMFLINDQVFITPEISNGYEINLQTKGEKVGEGFITLVGISAGVKF
jgi:hypothetical protein